MFDVSKSWLHWKELVGGFFFWCLKTCCYFLQKNCTKHQRTIAIGETESLCGPLVYLMFLEATKNKMVRKYVPDFFLWHWLSAFSWTHTNNLGKVFCWTMISEWRDLEKRSIWTWYLFKASRIIGKNEETFPFHYTTTVTGFRSMSSP